MYLKINDVAADQWILIICAKRLGSASLLNARVITACPKILLSYPIFSRILLYRNIITVNITGSIIVSGKHVRKWAL